MRDYEEERAARVWGKLLPGETYTAKVRNALTQAVMLIDSLERGELVDDQLQDMRKGIESTFDHLAAIDKERYELLLAIDDIKGNLRIVADRVKGLMELDNSTRAKVRARRNKIVELLEPVQFVLDKQDLKGDCIEELDAIEGLRGIKEQLELLKVEAG